MCAQNAQSFMEHSNTHDMKHPLQPPLPYPHPTRVPHVSLGTRHFGGGRGGGGGVTPERSEARCGRPEGGGGALAARTVKRPPQQPAQPQHTNYRAPLTRKRHIPPHPAQPRHTNDWAPRTRKRHQQEHRPAQRSDPTQHAGECPGPHTECHSRGGVAGGPRCPPLMAD